MNRRWAHISARSDASVGVGGRESAGVAAEVLLTLEVGEVITTRSIEICERHIPVQEVDIAERIGVLLAAHMITSTRASIERILVSEGYVLRTPILLFTDRHCLTVTLPACREYVSLINRIVRRYGLETHADVVLCWERRESPFMQEIDHRARNALERPVLPLGLLFPSLSDALNRNRALSTRLFEMENRFLERNRTNDGVVGNRG